MPYFKVVIALFAVVLPLGSPVAKAQDRSLEYGRVTPTDPKWSPAALDA